MKYSNIYNTKYKKYSSIYKKTIIWSKSESSEVNLQNALNFGRFPQLWSRRRWGNSGSDTIVSMPILNIQITIIY